MKETFIKLLNTFVKEDNPNIDSFKVWSLGAVNTYMYIVQVRSYYEMTKEERLKIQSDVTRIFKLMGFDSNSDFMIQYVKGNN